MYERGKLVNNKDFAQANEETVKLAEKLGQHIDPGIVETVTALRLRGFNVVDSCEGHGDKVTGGPFVMFEAPESKDLMAKLMAVQDNTSPEYQELYRHVSVANLKEVQKLLQMLDEFYAGRGTDHSGRIVARCFGPSVPKLMCQNADLAEVLPDGERKELLANNQLEMMAFTNFLKESE